MATPSIETDLAAAFCPDVSKQKLSCARQLRLLMSLRRDVSRLIVSHNLCHSLGEVSEFDKVVAHQLSNQRHTESTAVCTNPETAKFPSRL